MSSHQQLKDHLRTLGELREQVLGSDIHQFDSRVEEIERHLQRALLSYGLSTLVSVDSRAERGEGDGRGSGRAAAVVEDEKSSADDMG